MEWLQIGSAVLLIGMVIFMWPRMKHAVANSPKGTLNDWMGYIVPLAAVVGFIILLINMV